MKTNGNALNGKKILDSNSQFAKDCLRKVWWKTSLNQHVHVVSRKFADRLYADQPWSNLTLPLWKRKIFETKKEETKQARDNERWLPLSFLNKYSIETTKCEFPSRIINMSNLFFLYNNRLYLSALSTSRNKLYINSPIVFHTRPQIRASGQLLKPCAKGETVYLVEARRDEKEPDKNGSSRSFHLSRPLLGEAVEIHANFTSRLNAPD